MVTPSKEARDRWRKANPEIVIKHHKKYYQSSQDRAKRSRYLWTQEELDAILAREAPDHVLATRYGRSTHAIQTKRWVLKKEAKEKSELCPESPL